MVKNNLSKVFVLVFVFILSISAAYAQRLPSVGSDSNNWGNLLNNWLLVAHTGNGTLQDGLNLTLGSVNLTGDLRVAGNINGEVVNGFKLVNFTAAYDARNDRYSITNFTSNYDSRADRFGNGNFTVQLNNYLPSFFNNENFTGRINTYLPALFNNVNYTALENAAFRIENGTRLQFSNFQNANATAISAALIEASLPALFNNVNYTALENAAFRNVNFTTLLSTASINTNQVRGIGTFAVLNDTPDNNITTSKINNLAITDAKINDVAAAKITGSITDAQVSDTLTSSIFIAGNGTTNAVDLLSSEVSGVLSPTNGGTGSSTQNFVDLTTAQTIAGVKTFSSTITGSISGNAATATNLTTPLVFALGGTGATSATGVKANLGLDVTDSPTFAGVTLSGLSANKALVSNGTSGIISSSVSDTELEYLSGANSSLQTQIGLKQAYNARLADISTLAITADNFIVGNGANFVLKTPAQARTSIGLDNLNNVHQLPFSYLDTDSALTNNSDTKVASQKAVKAYADTKAALNSSGQIPTSQLPAYAGLNSSGLVYPSQLPAFGSLAFRSLIDVASGGTGITSYTTGDLIYASASTTLSKLGIGTADRILTSTGSAPQWVASLTDAQVDNTLTASIFAAGNGTTNAVDLLSSEVSGVLSPTNGGTGSSTQNFVDLTTAQTIAGVKTFSDTIVQKKGSDIASTAALALGSGNVFTITGTADITSITTSASDTGRFITLVFSGTAAGTGATDGSNLKLASNFIYSPDDSLTLVSDGTNWYEIARAVN